MKVLARLLLILMTCVIVSACSSNKVITASSSGKKKTDSHIVKPKEEKLTFYQKKIVKEAKSWIGTPYAYASAEKGKGTDCSGLVMKVYDTAMHYKIPRNSAKQAEFCTQLSDEEVEAGDLIFFATGQDPTKVSHVGIMVNTEEFVHSSSSKGVVISAVENPYFKRTFLKYGRIPQIAGMMADN